jgi:hypothetical protein
VALEIKTILALISFLVIALLVYPIIVSTQWDKLDFNSSNSGFSLERSAPVDWRALIDD